MKLCVPFKTRPGQVPRLNTLHGHVYDCMRLPPPQPKNAVRIGVLVPQEEDNTFDSAILSFTHSRQGWVDANGVDTVRNLRRRHKALPAHDQHGERGAVAVWLGRRWGRPLNVSVNNCLNKSSYKTSGQLSSST